MATELASPITISPQAVPLQKSKFLRSSRQDAHEMKKEKGDASWEPPVNLEYITAREMAVVSRVAFTFALLALAIALIAVIVSRFNSLTGNNLQLVPGYIVGLETGFASLLFVLMISVTAIYGKEVLGTPGYYRRTIPAATFALLLVLTIGIFPMRGLSELIRSGSPSVGAVHLMLASSFLSGCTTVAVLVFAWTASRACREIGLEGPGPGSVASNASLIAVVLMNGTAIIYVLTRVATAGVFNIVYAPLPFQSFIAFLTIVSSDLQTPLSSQHILSIVSTTLLEALLVASVWRSIALTSRFIQSADRTDFKSEYIFHTFTSKSIVAVVFPGILITLIQFGYPPEQAIAYRNAKRYLVLAPASGWSAMFLLLLIFALRHGYVSLPAQKDTHLQWSRYQFQNIFESNMQRMERQARNTEPNILLYRATDKKDKNNGNAVVEAQAFSLETAVLMFNCSWMVYTYGTNGFSPSKPADFERPDLQVVSHIRNDGLDVHAVVINAADRIIVSFKGSNTVSNALSDRDTALVSANEAFKDDEKPEGFVEGSLLLADRAHTWRASKTHRGYSLAYNGVRKAIVNEVRLLYHKKQRPVYVTGHSSGGSLATLFSLELAAFDDLCGPAKISVYTFGAPKVGNKGFSQIYDAVLASHWRCIVAGDSTTSSPVISTYNHVGNMALFTRHGQLSLEKFVELFWWQHETTSFPMYKLTSYYCAIAVWAQAAAGQSPKRIGLWNWPLDDSTKRHFRLGLQPINWHVFDIQSPGVKGLEKTPDRVKSAENVLEEGLDDIVAFAKEDV